MAAAPVTDLDLFSIESVRNARKVDDAIREMAPAVKLAREDVTMIGRFEHVQRGLADWSSFSNTSRPWHDPTSPRPEILLTDDPPRHTEVRQVIARAMSKRKMAAWADRFRSDATALVDRLLELDGEVIDATHDSRQLAMLEAEALLGELAERVDRFEPAGEPEPWLTTVGHGPASAPVRIHAR
jgi:cytochrome P450